MSISATPNRLNEEEEVIEAGAVDVEGIVAVEVEEEDAAGSSEDEAMAASVGVRGVTAAEDEEDVEIPRSMSRMRMLSLALEAHSALGAPHSGPFFLFAGLIGQSFYHKRKI